MRLMVVAACLAGIVFCLYMAQAQQTITWFSLPDIAGTGAAVALASSGTARLCQIVAPAANTSHVRWGDASITTTQGADMAPGGGQFLPPGPSTDTQGRGYIFSLAQTFVLVQVGDKVTVTCAR